MARKKALNKDIRVEIKKSLGRYISIFLIVALGVSFFSGLRSTESDMRYTGDAFSDASNLMDIRVISTMGLTDDDVEALSQIEGISGAEPGYMKDVWTSLAPACCPAFRFPCLPWHPSPALPAVR